MLDNVSLADFIGQVFALHCASTYIYIHNVILYGVNVKYNNGPKHPAIQL